MLDAIKSPADLRLLDESRLKELADELRAETINAVSTNIGGASFDWKAYRLSNQALNFNNGAKIDFGNFKVLLKNLFLCT